MSSFRIRPRFRQEFSCSPDDLQRDFKTELEQADCPCEASMVKGFIVLMIPENDRHYWSPQLTLSIETQEEGSGAVLRGLYGPAPKVWSGFFFGYVAIGVLVTFIGLIGSSLWSLDKDASILWAVPALLLLGVILYIIAQAGQKIGAQQMFTLHHFVETISNKRIEIK